jgi:hypothetical protein
MYRAKLPAYRHPRRCNNNFLFCLSRLYSIGKGAIMPGLASRGVLEFNRDEAFRWFAALNPDLEEQVAKVARLRAFYRLVSGRRRSRYRSPIMKQLWRWRRQSMPSNPWRSAQHARNTICCA